MSNLNHPTIRNNSYQQAFPVKHFKPPRKKSHAINFVWEKKVPQNPMVYLHLHTTIAIVFGLSVVGLPNSEPNWRARTLGQDPP